MKRRRVKITGIGPVTPAGVGRDAFWQGILEPVSRVRPFTGLGPEYGPIVAGYLEHFDISRHIDRARLPKGVSRQAMFAIAGTALALADAGLHDAEIAEARTAIVTGSSLMDFGGLMSSIDAVYRKGAKFAHGRTVQSVGVGSVASAINHAFGFNARSVGISNQCSSGMDAIGYGASLVATGEAEIVLCGGAEAPLHRTPLLELRAAEIIAETEELANRQARPFDLWRNTGVIGEGSAMFILEPENSPRRGYSYVAGYAFSNDHRDKICSGLLEAGRTAIGHAGISMRDIEVLSAWGPGDTCVDRGEADAMKLLFAGRLDEKAAFSNKGAIGSALGAAPAIQIAAAALSQRTGLIPPTVNWEYPDPDCPFHLSKTPMAVCHRTTLVNSHGVGAVNSSMILERC